MSDFKGNVYIVCFDKPFLNRTTGQKCMHYIGFATFLGLRMAHHRNGTGSSFLKAVNEAGISYIVSRVFNHVDREFERKLKKRKETKKFCPRCSEKILTPRDYIEPEKPQKRAYKSRIFLDNVIISDVIVDAKILIQKLSKRFRVGETFILNGKLYTRVNKRKHKKFFDIEVTVQPIEPTKLTKDLVPTDMFKYQDYLRDSVNKSENCVVEETFTKPVHNYENEEIPF